MLRIDKQRLQEALKAFYVITKVKISVYDADFKEITAYPGQECSFCRLLQNSAAAKTMCEKSDAYLFRECVVQESRIAIHKCHAGLTEVAAPLTDNGVVIGYVIFGQVRSEQNAQAFAAEVVSRCKDYGFEEGQLRRVLDSVQYCSDEQIEALSLLLDMTVSHIVSNRLAYKDAETLAEEVKAYLLENLSANLRIEEICRRFWVSRPMLYKMTKDDMPEGILAFVKKERLKLAKKLLLETTKTLPEIAAETGYGDVEYFQRIFKRETGISAGKFRKESWQGSGGKT